MYEINLPSGRLTGQFSLDVSAMLVSLYVLAVPVRLSQSFVTACCPPSGSSPRCKVLTDEHLLIFLIPCLRSLLSPLSLSL